MVAWRLSRARSAVAWRPVFSQGIDGFGSPGKVVGRLRGYKTWSGRRGVCQEKGVVVLTAVKAEGMATAKSWYLASDFEHESLNFIS